MIEDSIYLELLFVAAVVIFVVELSGFRETLLDVASRVAGRRIREIRPLTCSLCMTWWVTLLVALCTGRLTLPVAAYCGALAYASGTLSQIIIFIDEALKALIRLLADWLKL